MYTPNSYCRPHDGRCHYTRWSIEWYRGSGKRLRMLLCNWNTIDISLTHVALSRRSVETRDRTRSSSPSRLVRLSTKCPSLCANLHRRSATYSDACSIPPPSLTASIYSPGPLWSHPRSIVSRSTNHTSCHMSLPFPSTYSR